VNKKFDAKKAEFNKNFDDLIAVMKGRLDEI